MASLVKTRTRIERKRSQVLVAGVVAALALGAITTIISTSMNMLLQPAYAHALNVKGLQVHGDGVRQVTIVLGHANEPTYGAKPGITDGKHGVEVFLEDTATGLPITGANLRVDKYYFSDLSAFNNATSINNATEIQRNVTLGPVFGEPGHYIARQVQKDGIYGYRLYGTISYFSVGNLDVNSTVFCTSTNGNTTKFNSPGWSEGFGCTQDIGNILFPQRNNDVNPAR
jgi:hypothetical protein